MTILRRYRSLTGQAEKLDAYECYKELITTIEGMTCEELYDLMVDTQTVLKVLCRDENVKQNTGGVRSLTSTIIQLGATFLEKGNYPLPFEVGEIGVSVKTPYTRYIYEIIEEKEKNHGGKDV